MKRFRLLMALGAIATALILVAGDANARVGGGGSFGSRGARTYSAPPATRTAPNTARPIERSVTQPSRPNNTVGSGATASGGGLFGRPGLLGGLAAGFLGAGLFGLLFGHGLFGGLGGFASMFGLLLQIVVVIFVARLAWAWWQRRNAPAFAGVPRGMSAPSYGRDGPMGAGGFASTGAPLNIGKDDYDAFERLLGEVQQAYSDEDLSALRARVTPEMLSYFSDDLAANASRGVVNHVSDVKLLKGDLAEAWREGATDYATVAMHFAIRDRTVERETGRLVEGSEALQEVTEIWTFRRDGGGRWLLSAIQQA